VIDGNTPLSALDVKRLAEMQLEHLPTSLVSILGLGYSRAFYRYIARSHKELLFLERNREDDIIGIALLSKDMETFERRLLLHTPLIFAALLRIPQLVRLLTGGKSEEAARLSPELVTLYTDASARGMGLGGKLVDRLTRRLEAEKIPELFVRTFDDPADPAVRFYTNRGFQQVSSIMIRGTPFMLLKKQLNAG